MNISGASSMEQMQMRKMDGTGASQGKGGMKDIMQSLSMEDRSLMKDSLSSMSQEDRMAAISQMKSVEKAGMDAEEYTKALLDILDQTTTEDAQIDGFSVYV